METLEHKLDFAEAFKQSFVLAWKNFLPILLTLVLYIITCWIPYLNVGTTIGLYRIMINLGRGEKIDPLSIFSKDNFSQIGDFFLLYFFMLGGTIVALCFMVIPALVISIAWGCSYLILIDKKETANKSLSLSFKITLGEKWKIFFIYLVLVLILAVVAALLCLIPKAGIVLASIFAVFYLIVMIASESYIYSVLSKKLE